MAKLSAKGKKYEGKKSARRIRHIQMIFEFNQTISQVIREQANKNELSASDQIRTIIGLTPPKPKRPRLSVSLSEQDYQQLAKRYNLTTPDKTQIRQAIARELIDYSQSLPL